MSGDEERHVKMSLDSKMECAAGPQDMTTEQPVAKDVQHPCHATPATRPVEAPKEPEETKKDEGSRVPSGKQPAETKETKEDEGSRVPTGKQQPMVPMTVSATNGTNDPEMTADRIKDLKSRLAETKKNMKKERKETKSKSSVQKKAQTAAKSKPGTKGKKDVKKTTRKDKQEESDNALESESELTGEDQVLAEEASEEMVEAHFFF
jgi:hypothetical protein